MVKNYLVVALHNMMRHKGYSAINIAGLALGMACCILVLLFVQDEFKYDAFHDHSDRSNADGVVGVNVAGIVVFV